MIRQHKTEATQRSTTQRRASTITRKQTQHNFTQNTDRARATQEHITTPYNMKHSKETEQHNTTHNLTTQHAEASPYQPETSGGAVAASITCLIIHVL